MQGRFAFARYCLFLVALALCQSLTVADDAPYFERDIAPLLANHCLECHQPSKRSGELNLATRETILSGGESGAAISLDTPAESLLLKRVIAGEMPPPDARETKRLTATEIATLDAWIRSGVEWPKDRELGVHEKTVDLEAARTFWSFQPVRRPVVPASQHAANPIDSFIDQRLAAAKLVRGPRAKAADLLRRVSLDVRGLPPTIAEQDAFLTEASPLTYECLIDLLLADPAYGERWGRHWLDLVRYADSNGYERDGPKPSVWRYRDYVIASLNQDKPYDRFVLEQIAGDELPDSSEETVLALGFHALGTWQDEVDPLERPQYRADELDDMIRTTTQTFLGITLGCARCHNHKFDPLTMVDYYSFAAILAPLKRPNEGRTDRDRPIGSPEQVGALVERDVALAALRKQMEELLKGTPEAELSLEPKERLAALRTEQRQLRAATPDLPRGYFLFEDSSEAPSTHLLLSGRASNPGPLMQPRVPAVLTTSQPLFPPPQEQSTRRRLVLAKWISSAENPLTARVIVNRVWQHHFGTGLVATASDFGHIGARPSHPELLDWLADWFVHEAGWSLKKLHRLILTSETYCQSCQPNAVGTQRDPENKLLWRFPYQRLDVEVIRDSMLAAAGNLQRDMGGPAVFLPVPAAAIEAHTDKQAAWHAATEPAINRRTIYAYVKRTLIVPMLEALDFCDTTQSADRRVTTSVAPQALTLFNGDFVNRQAEVFAMRLEAEAGPDCGKQIELAYRLALSRRPQQLEGEALLRFMDQEAKSCRNENVANSESAAQHYALRQACRVILNLNEFVYPN